jgi:hypothetical protein
MWQFSWQRLGNKNDAIQCCQMQRRATGNVLFFGWILGYLAEEATVCNAVQRTVTLLLTGWSMVRIPSRGAKSI